MSQPETRDESRPSSDGPLIFDALLTPHRSLPPSGFRWVMFGIAGVLAPMGIYFMTLGAWPVFGFCGLEILLIWLGFRASYISGRAFERLHLTHERLRVEQTDHRGRTRAHDFQPYWLRVELVEPDAGEEDGFGPRELALTSHGRRLIIGHFLTPEERRDLARALETALHRARMPQPTETLLA
ncbi:DUF2244 domain-containing protein [Tistrella mobilis]|uniref:DUF2244 domain-containing protein n=1 Tax=Tistrella mobilis TaxID=171437 RepID=UPI0035579E58